MMGPKPKDPSVRFWAKVDKDCPGGCWLWRASKGRGGYGNFMLSCNGRSGTFICAHVFAYRELRGEVAAGHALIQTCGNHHCVNPDHIKVATYEFCPHGHAYTEENTIIDRKGCKQCRECKKAGQRKWWRDHHPLPDQPKKEDR